MSMTSTANLAMTLCFFRMKCHLDRSGRLAVPCSTFLCLFVCMVLGDVLTIPLQLHAEIVTDCYAHRKTVMLFSYLPVKIHHGWTDGNEFVCRERWTETSDSFAALRIT